MSVQYTVLYTEDQISAVIFALGIGMIFVFVFQWVVMKMGYLLSITVGTTAAESLNAAANIFLGQTEAPLLIKPFLGIMTKYF